MVNDLLGHSEGIHSPALRFALPMRAHFDVDHQPAG